VHETDTKKADHPSKNSTRTERGAMKLKLYLTVFLVLLFAHQSFAGAVPDVPHIVVTGEAELQATPDILTLSLSIADTGFEVAAARDSVESRSVQLIKALTALDIAKEDIRSAQLQITPHYNWNNQAQIYVGTEVSRTIDVTLRDLDRYDDLIRSIIDAGVARIHSTRLSSSKEKELRQEAMAEAIADGMDKARIMVAHLPEQVGAVYSIAPASSGGPFPEARYQMAAADSRSAFEPGTILFQESLQIVFYLVQGK
jgi:hypothetical protein